MRKYVLPSIVMFAFVFSIAWANVVFAQEQQTLAEKLLEIMRANHQITEAQYKELKEEAQKEKAAAAQQGTTAQAAATQAAESARAAMGQAAQAAQTALAIEAGTKGNPLGLQASWQNGLVFQSTDGAFDVHVGGRIQEDIADSEPNKALDNYSKGQFTSGLRGPKTDGFGDQMRRVRLAIDGTLWKDVEFISQIEFAPTYSATTVLKSSVNSTSKIGQAQYFADLTTGYTASFQDVWMGVKDIPFFGRIRAGQMYEPIGLEQQTVDNFNTFMEKALPQNALIPSRNLGLLTQNTACNDRLGWQAGYFFAQQTGTPYNGVATDATGDLFSPHVEATDVAVRLYALPWYENNGEHLLHVGIGYQHRFRSDSQSPSNPGWLDFSSYPEAYMFNPLVDTGYFLATGADVIDPEIALVCGPFSVQGEYTWMSVNDVSLPAASTSPTSPTWTSLNRGASFSGWYAQASYFLTGEHRPYYLEASSRNYQATFGRIIPNANFNPRAGGIGAWEVAFRVSNLDLNDPAARFTGGDETDYTAGLNWYLNPNVMIKMNYIYATVGAHAAEQNTLVSSPTALLTGGHDNIFETRFQIAF
ncbi:putative Phosphate-selective porin O and P [Syntrophobacter sp. SbD2]|nr:putative Phosphate-selective porin O and P [Syntrophobacter sp. SbD2]